MIYFWNTLLMDRTLEKFDVPDMFLSHIICRFMWAKFDAKFGNIGPDF